MKKNRKLLISLCLILTLALGLCGTALAADSSVSYSGTTKSFTFDPSANLFGNFADVMPGDTLSQNIDVIVSPAPNMETRIYLRAEVVPSANLPNGETAASMKDFLSQLSMSVKQGSTLLYQASPDQLGGLQSNVLLGVFRRAGSARLTIELTVPTTLRNEYAERTGLVRWVLTADEVPIQQGGGTTVTPTPQPTETPAETPTPTPAPTEPAEIKPEEVTDDKVPIADFTDDDDKAGSSWALVNLISAIGTVGLSAGTIGSFVKNSKTLEDEEAKKKLRSKLISAVPAVGSVVTFLLTEDMRAPMVIVDKWTLLMAGILGADGLTTYLTRVKKNIETAVAK